MFNLKKKALGMAVVLTALLAAGCSGDFIERTKFEVETVDGKVLTLACPVLNLERSSISYIYDGDCVVTNVRKGS